MRPDTEREQSGRLPRRTFIALPAIVTSAVMLATQTTSAHGKARVLECAADLLGDE